MLRKRRKRHSCLAVCAALLLSLPVPLFAQERPPVPPQYGRYFFKYTDKRSVPEKLLNMAGLTTTDVGRSFALLCDVSEYPNISSSDGHLPAAAEDIRKLKEYLEQNEFFDEIVVLENEQVTTANLEYFLQAYFADRLKKFPKARFLFAYSGHGMTENNTGYLLKSTARDLHDRRRAIKVDVLKDYIDEVVVTGHHVLVLLNSCYSGTFLRRSFGKNRLFPQYPGVHAITAGGSGEAAWHDGRLGPGSVFFEKIFAGLRGNADRAVGDSKPDGIITAHELGSYLIDEIRLFSRQDQNPQMGDISLHGSRGEFFFLHRGTPLVQREGVKMYNGIAQGGSAQEVVLFPFESKQSETWTEPTTGMEFVRDDDEGPVHKVCVDGFWLGKYEVTNGQFRRFRPRHDSGEYEGKSLNGEKQPVVRVSWEDARDYAVWLARQSGQEIRLPTEAEWEYAARAGTSTARFWGDAPDDACRYANVHDQTSKKENGFSWMNHNCNDGYAVTAPVGSFRDNAFGLHDMLGNVWEWCADWYDTGYSEQVGDNPQGPATGELRVLRGGSWSDIPDDVRCSIRDRNDPDNRYIRYDFMGFRVVFSLADF
ncbi:MAG: hypothetical protein D3906_04420 [Candidatus Electrothrix sp. AUS1_2]|nr:hypothetical protein [Candidatus Electrothrix sp. AUS1_2]